MKFLKILVATVIALAIVILPVVFLVKNGGGQDLTGLNEVIDRSVTTLGFENGENQSPMTMASSVAFANGISNDEVETMFDSYFTEDGVEKTPISFVLMFTGVAVQLRAIDLGLDDLGNGFELSHKYGQSFVSNASGDTTNNMTYTYIVDWDAENEVAEIESTIQSVFSNGQISKAQQFTRVEKYGESGFSLKCKWVQGDKYTVGDDYYTYNYLSLKIDGDSVDELMCVQASTNEFAITTETVDEWIASGKSVRGHMTGSYKNGKGVKEPTEQVSLALAKSMIDDFGLNFAGFDEKFNNDFDAVTWIHSAVQEYTDLVNEMNGVA